MNLLSEMTRGIEYSHVTAEGRHFQALACGVNELLVPRSGVELAIFWCLVSN